MVVNVKTMKFKLLCITNLDPCQTRCLRKICIFPPWWPKWCKRNTAHGIRVFAEHRTSLTFLFQSCCTRFSIEDGWLWNSDSELSNCKCFVLLVHFYTWSFDKRRNTQWICNEYSISKWERNIIIFFQMKFH